MSTSFRGRVKCGIRVMVMADLSGALGQAEATLTG
jgi:hypothetical protein